MKKLLTVLPIVVSLLLVGIFGLLLGRYIFPDTRNKGQEVVTSRSIVQSISSQGFLVTQVIIAEHKVTHTVDKGSDWSNFWWGHRIVARATTATSVGIDLGKIDESMVKVDVSNRTVCFNYPAPSIQATSLNSEIEVETTSGLLKKIFASSANNDYNLALSLLKTDSEKTVASIASLNADVYKQADKTIGFMISKTAYSVIADCRR